MISVVIYMKIQKLKEIRESYNLTQRETAEKLGMTLGTYAMNETGSDTITLTNLVKFCDAFKVSLDYVFDFSDSQNYENSLKGINREVLQERLKTVRKDNNFTQEKLGKYLNIDHSVWCRYELGTTLISTTFLYAFASKFNISADYLLGKINKN